nr:triple gene block protein 1 [Cowpea mild mottle virus]
MNELLAILSDYGFHRLGHRLSEPIVVNCVPGAGKTHLINKLLENSDNFEAYTTSSPGQVNLTGKRIKHISDFQVSNKLILIDEYQNLKEIPEGAFAIFGDPLQASKPLNLPADFVCYTSRRFGKDTAALLSLLGFRVQSDLEDEVVKEDIFLGEPEGQIICFETEVIDLLKAHNLEFLTPCTSQGKSFRTVTFITSGLITQENKHEHLICLSRHTSKLKILSPQARYPSEE